MPSRTSFCSRNCFNSLKRQVMTIWMDALGGGTHAIIHWFVSWSAALCIHFLSEKISSRRTFVCLKQPAKVLLWFCSWFRGNFECCDWLEEMQSRRVIGRSCGIASPDWSAQMREAPDWSNTNRAAFNCAAQSALIGLLPETVEVLKKQILVVTLNLFWSLAFPSDSILLGFIAYFEDKRSCT